MGSIKEKHYNRHKLLVKINIIIAKIKTIIRKVDNWITDVTQDLKRRQTVVYWSNYEYYCKIFKNIRQTSRQFIDLQH